jgi:hypothetical protein
MKKIVVILLAIGFITVNCTKNKAEEIKAASELPCGDSVSYQSIIETQIINPSCNTTGCHNSSSAGGYSFTNYQLVADNADLIYSVISHEAGFTGMPLSSAKLTDSLIIQFKCWIDQGKLDN